MESGKEENVGYYLNPGSEMFRSSVRSRIYVDKSLLISEMNRCIGTEQKYICVSRPRRFGKTMAANMLGAYYSKSEKTEDLFDKLKISRDDSYRIHLNRYDVIRVNMQEFLSMSHDVNEMLGYLQKRIIRDLKRNYEVFIDSEQLPWVMADIYSETRIPFVILIDEWDCLFREYQHDVTAQKKYLDFLRGWLKDQPYVALAYMTGILPIKKYGTHSALNMFTEYSMTDPGVLAEYFGFTENEVKELCHRFEMNFEETQSWYDGYKLFCHGKKGDRLFSMYSPKSVVESMLRHKFGTYWNQTETYEALRSYIIMDQDGLKKSVIEMLSGDTVPIKIGTFSNDMLTFHKRDDVLTLLVHLGYLNYNEVTQCAGIPNKEVSQEYINAISTTDWSEVADSIDSSRKLMEALLGGDAETVARGIEKAHDEISILQYNDENSLSCTVSLALYYAREYYTFVREFPSGKGFADICLIPRKMHLDKPAVIIELKRGNSAQEAIAQIKQKKYSEALRDYKGNLLLVGISYDKEKKHTCIIESAEA